MADGLNETDFLTPEELEAQEAAAAGEAPPVADEPVEAPVDPSLDAESPQAIAEAAKQVAHAEERVAIAQANAEGPVSVVDLAEGVDGPIAVQLGGLDVENVQRDYVDDEGRVVVEGGGVEVHPDAAELLRAVPQVTVELAD